MKPQTKYAVDAYAHMLREKARAKIAQLMYDRILGEVESEEIHEFVLFTNKMLKAYEDWEKSATEDNLAELVAALKVLTDEKDAA